MNTTIRPSQLWFFARALLCTEKELGTEELAEKIKNLSHNILPWETTVVAAYWRASETHHRGEESKIEYDVKFNLVSPDDQVFRGYVRLLSYLLNTKRRAGLVERRPGAHGNNRYNLWKITEKGKQQVN